MENIKQILIDQMEEHSIKEERLMSILQLASYMIGKINVSEGKISDNEEINNNYSHWLESIIDLASNEAKNQNSEFDVLIELVNRQK